MSYKFAFSNKKKVRGWKTQIRRMERWRTEYLTPDWPHFNHYGYAYCKIQIDPWNRLVKRQPPLWLGRQMIHGLLDICDAWVEAIPDAAYLRVWLMWPYLIGSQVGMSGPSRLDWYSEMFRPVESLSWAEARGFPPQFGPELLERLKGYQWTECLDEYSVDSDDVSEAWLSRRPHSSLTNEDGSFLTLVEQGRVWVGTRRESA